MQLPIDDEVHFVEEKNVKKISVRKTLTLKMKKGRKKILKYQKTCSFINPKEFEYKNAFILPQNPYRAFTHSVIQFLPPSQQVPSEKGYWHHPKINQENCSTTQWSLCVIKVCLNSAWLWPSKYQKRQSSVQVRSVLWNEFLWFNFECLSEKMI